MPRSHPPTLLTLTARTLADECGPIRGQRILVATSGGADSQALLHVLARHAERFRLSLVAHGVDHGLRPEAGAELELAADLARSLGVPFSITKLGMQPGGNLQARARAERYRALEQACAETGADLIATAHHADDRAETVLLRLLRGTRVAGLGVLPPRAGDRIRPFVRARKADVVAHVLRHGILHAHDPSNSNRRFLRVRVRHELMPLLESLSPGIVEHLTALADELCAPAPPLLVDETTGEPVVLGRAQLTALRRLLARRSPTARVRLSGGRSVRYDSKLGTAVVEPEGRPPTPRKSRRSGHGPSGAGTK